MQQNDNAGKWGTIRGNHVFIADAPRGTLNLANPSGTGPTPQDQPYLEALRGDNGNDLLSHGPTLEKDEEWLSRNPKSAKAMKSALDEIAERKGFRVVGYHASHEDFQTFDRTRGYRNPNGTNVEALGSWFPDSPDTARVLYGPKVRPFYLKTETAGVNSLKVYQGLGAWNRMAKDVTTLGGVESYREVNRVFNGVRIDGDYVDGELQTIHVMFEPTTSKSASLITRTDAGDIILPSQRFSFKNPDTRF